MSNNCTKDENKKGKEKGERHDKVKVAKKIAKVIYLGNIIQLYIVNFNFVEAT